MSKRYSEVEIAALLGDGAVERLKAASARAKAAKVKMVTDDDLQRARTFIDYHMGLRPEPYKMTEANRDKAAFVRVLTKVIFESPAIHRNVMSAITSLDGIVTDIQRDEARDSGYVMKSSTGPCPECEREFRTVLAMSIHRSKAHGVRGTARKGAASV